MTATEIKLEEPSYYCESCETWRDGEAEKIKAKYTEGMSYIDPDYFYLSVTEWDAASLIAVIKCGDCDNVSKDPPDDEAYDNVIQLLPGHLVYECDDCGNRYLDPEKAEECCS